LTLDCGYQAAHARDQTSELQIFPCAFDLEVIHPLLLVSNII